MEREELEKVAVDAAMDQIKRFAADGLDSGLTEDQHAIVLAHVVNEVQSLGEKPVALVWALRATKNGSQIRQIAEKRGILKAKASLQDDLFARYTQ